MKHQNYSLIVAIIWLFSLINGSKAYAMATANDTVQFSTENFQIEDNPNKGEYCLTFFSPDDNWKMQLFYWSEHMFGTFTNDDFHLTGDGKYYNFVRNPHNDMVFYSLTDIELTVTDAMSSYEFHANCLASNGTRFIVDASYTVPMPTDTISSSLGYASMVANDFFGTHSFKAENDDYRLEYGIVSNEIEGTFYTADLLKPELFDKHRQQMIDVTSAQAIHQQRNDTLWLTLDVLSADMHLYHLTMWNTQREIEIVSEEEINFEPGQTAMEDLTLMYGCYQIAGQNNEWAASLALAPTAFENGDYQWDMADIFMPYTLLARIKGETYEKLDVAEVHASAVSTEYGITFKADYITYDGICYHVTLPLVSNDYMPTPKETINIDFGNAAVLDFSKGEGIIGIGGVLPDQYQLRCYFYGNTLEGDYTTSYMIADMCDMMVVRDNTYSFRDAWKVNASFELDADSVNHVTIDMMTNDTILYHATMQIPAMRCLQGGSYGISPDDDVTMIGLREEQIGDVSTYTLQLQNVDEVYDDDYRIVGDGFVFSFAFSHEGDGLSGEYGYTAGTLSSDEPYTFFEQGCEVRMAPIAGTLHLTPVENIILKDYGIDYHTTLYQISFKVLGQCGAIYEAEGQNCLLCISDDGELIEINEPELASLHNILAERGYKVKKIMQNGQILIVSHLNTQQENEEILYSSDGICRHTLR